MITVWVTLDPARKDNSCKQVRVYALITSINILRVHPPLSGKVSKRFSHTESEFGTIFQSSLISMKYKGFSYITGLFGCRCFSFSKTGSSNAEFLTVVKSYNFDFGLL